MNTMSRLHTWQPLDWKRRLLSVVLLFLLLVSDAAAQAQDSQRFLDWIGDDPVDAFHEIGKTEALVAIGSAAVLVALSYADRDLSNWTISKNRRGLAGTLSVTNELGGVWTLPATAAIFGMSMLTGNHRFQDAAFTSLESVLVSAAFVVGTKTLVGRRRPYEGYGPSRFEPFRSIDASFPSGHTANAFAAVVPFVYYHRNPLSYSLLGAATLTGIARVAKGYHWPTDIIAGAVIGTTVGILLSRIHQSCGANAGEGGPQIPTATFKIPLDP